MNFPRYLFRDGGPFQREGGTYNSLLAQDEDQVSEALGNGWFMTLPEAVEAPKAPPLKEDAPPSRQELEAKAGELGLSWPKGTRDKTLLAMIESKLAGS